MRPGNTIPTPLTYTTDTYLFDSYLASLRAGQSPTTVSADSDQTTPLSGKQQAARQQRQKVGVAHTVSTGRVADARARAWPFVCIFVCRES